MTKLREDIRNIAIIAHVDHGKTTLVDELLKQSETLDARTELAERAMDSNDIEKERGITILAKNTAVAYNGTRINIMDTPGHADFGGEVERIMKMVDGVVLVVDAYEGTMPQTRFVLKKALEQDLVPIVVVNKIDKPSARPAEVVDEVLELFIELGADDDQLDFPVVYASAINGTSSLSDDPADQEKTMAPIFDTIIDHIPAPVDNSDEPLQFQVSLLDYNDFVGRIGIGRIFRGSVKVGDQVTLSKLDGTTKNFRVTKLFGFFGLERREIQEAKAGDLIAVSGMEDIFVGETITPTDAVEALPVLHIDEPTLQMTFLVNNSPFAGREGKWVTSRKVEERLHCQMIQLTKKRLWRQSLIPLLTTFQLQSITQMSHFNSKCHSWTTTISLVVSVSDVSSVVLLRSETKLLFLNWMVQPRTSVLQNSLVSLVWNVVKSKKLRLVT